MISQWAQNGNQESLLNRPALLVLCLAGFVVVFLFVFVSVQADLEFTTLLLQSQE